MRCCAELANVTKTALFLLVVFFSVAAATGAAGGQSAPVAVVEKLNTALLSAMKGGEQLGFDGRFALLKPVIEDVFDVRVVTRISVGRQWPQLSRQQREVLQTLYARWSAATYASNFDDYNGQRFDIEGETITGKNADVTSSLIKKDGERVQFNYMLIKSDRAWRIVDIHIKGVSQLALTRAQFTSILKRNGYEGLVKSLQKKIRELGSGD